MSVVIARNAPVPSPLPRIVNATERHPVPLFPLFIQAIQNLGDDLLWKNMTGLLKTRRDSLETAANSFSTKADFLQKVLRAAQLVVDTPTTVARACTALEDCLKGIDTFHEQLFPWHEDSQLPELTPFLSELASQHEELLQIKRELEELFAQSSPGRTSSVGSPTPRPRFRAARAASRESANSATENTLGSQSEVLRDRFRDSLLRLLAFLEQEKQSQGSQTSRTVKEAFSESLEQEKKLGRVWEQVCLTHQSEQRTPKAQWEEMQQTAASCSILFHQICKTVPEETLKKLSPQAERTLLPLVRSSLRQTDIHPLHQLLALDVQLLSLIALNFAAHRTASPSIQPSLDALVTALTLPDPERLHSGDALQNCDPKELAVWLATRHKLCCQLVETLALITDGRGRAEDFLLNVLSLLDEPGRKALLEAKGIQRFIIHSRGYERFIIELYRLQPLSDALMLKVLAQYDSYEEGVKALGLARNKKDPVIRFPKKPSDTNTTQMIAAMATSAFSMVGNFLSPARLHPEPTAAPVVNTAPVLEEASVPALDAPVTAVPPSPGPTVIEPAALPSSISLRPESVEEAPTRLPNVLEALYPEPDSTASRVESWAQGSFGPIVRIAQRFEGHVRSVIRSEEDEIALIDYLHAQYGVRAESLAHYSTLMGNVEALLNWGGRIPFVCVLTGGWRVTMGTVITLTSSLFALGVYANGDENASLIMKQYTVQHGLGNIVRGLLESSSWVISMTTNLFRDLFALRVNYPLETPSSFHLTPVLKTLNQDTLRRAISLVQPVQADSEETTKGTPALDNAASG